MHVPTITKTHNDRRQYHAEKLQHYLASGGKVQEIPRGVSGTVMAGKNRSQRAAIQYRERALGFANSRGAA